MVTVADTAFSIAVVRAEEGERPEGERLFVDPFAHLFAAAGAHAAEATQRYLDLPFFREGVRLRTRFIDDVVRDAIRDGLRQLVILGAGFDMRGLRLPEVEQRGVAVYEIDSPEQLSRKRALLGAAGVTLPKTNVYVPFDFDQPELDTALAKALTDRGFRAGEGAAFVWEGVIGYIDADTIARSLRFMANIGGAGSRLVFTYGFVTFDPEGADVHLRRAGFSTSEEHGLDEIARRHLPGEPHPGASSAKIGVATV